LHRKKGFHFSASRPFAGEAELRRHFAWGHPTPAQAFGSRRKINRLEPKPIRAGRQLRDRAKSKPLPSRDRAKRGYGRRNTNWRPQALSIKRTQRLRHGLLSARYSLAQILEADLWGQILGAEMTPAYDDTNVFAKILRGELPCHKVYEDDIALAFMDIMPRADGHVLIVPKTPARNILDIDPMVLGELVKRVQLIAGAAKKGLDAEGISVMQFNEAAGGQVVFHLHFHVMPRWGGVALRPPGIAGKAEEIQGFRDRIVAALMAQI
jgi:histidine triad (HIT) family protein